MTEGCLKGEVTVEQVVKWSADEWRAFQYKHMLETDKRLDQLENQASIRNALISIPWMILGGVVVYLIGL
jgi:hypothetical protein